MATQVRARPLVAYVTALALATTLPPLVLSVVTATRWLSAERARLQTATRETTDHAVAQVDRYITGKIAMLQALATSPALDVGDFRKLDVQARELLDLQGLNIVLRDLNGQQHVNVRVPWGTPLPRVPNYEVDHLVVSSKAPYVSDLYVGVMARGPLVRIIAPVIRGDRIIYTLTASLSPAALTALLREAGVSEPYVGSVRDRSGRLLASIGRQAESDGFSPPNAAQGGALQGSWTARSEGGEEILGNYRRSTVSGWTFSVGVDKAMVDGPLFRSLALLAGLAAALGALAFAASAWLARRIISSQRELAAAAEAVGGGAVIEAPRTAVREANLIGDALAGASIRLRDQAAALVAANHELEERVAERTREVSAQADLIGATVDNMDQGLILIDADGTVPLCNQRARELLDLPAWLMDSRPTFSEVRRHQLSKDEFRKSDGTLRQWVADGGIEFDPRVYERERPNGTVLEVRTVPLATGGAVRTFTDVTARKRVEQLSHHMARHDPLTELPNRTHFRERLAQELGAAGRRGGPFAVFCLDLDRFKAVNDTLGHPAGDKLLRLAAERLRAALRPEDSIARLGGDEFAIVQASGPQPRAASALASRLTEVIREPFDLDGHVVGVGVSIGIAVAPQDGADADSLFKSADLALYRAKREGRNAFRFYEAAMDVAAQARQALEIDLRQALERGELELHYQPVVDVDDEAITSFEALIRWRHPELGIVAPAEFIPLAEETRLIVPLGAWVLREACRAAMSWPAPIGVAVNISAIQVEDPGLLASVMGAIAASGLPPSRLELEITETVLMHESAAVLAALHALRDFGVRVALDDFGAGYSSLNYLRQFPLDAVKVDRSYVAGLDDPTTAAIFGAVIGLGRQLGMSVTVEGVETAEQLAAARLAGCTAVQGFLFSRPVPAADAACLARHRPHLRAA